MKNTLIALLFIWLRLTPFAIAETNTEALEAADSVLAKAGNLDGFLANRALVNEYYVSLQKIYGNETEFPRASFNKIISQLTNIKERVPGLKEGLWKARTGEGYVSAFTIKPATEVTGRAMVATKWSAFVSEKIVAPLQAELGTLGEPTARSSRVGAILQDAQEKIAAFQKEVAELPGGRKAKDAAAGKFYKTLRENVEFKAATAYLLSERMKSQDVRARFQI